MPLGLKLGDLIDLAREANAGAHPRGPIVVGGARRDELATALRVDGDASLVRAGGPPDGLAYVHIVERSVGPGDVDALRAAARSGAPFVGVVLGGDPSLPYVLAEDIVVAPGPELPVDEIVHRLVLGLREDSVDLAARLPAIRAATARQRTHDTALSAATLAGLKRGSGPLTPAISLLQARMLRQLEVITGAPPPADPKQLGAVFVPEIVAALGMGYAARTLVRSLPVRGRAVEAAVAFGGTWALARLALRARG